MADTGTDHSRPRHDDNSSAQHQADPVPPVQRYSDASGLDAPATSSRRTRVGRAAGVAFIAAVAVVASWLIIDSQRDSIQAGLRSYGEPVDGVMPVTIEVDRNPDIALTCELSVVDSRFVVVGQLSLKVPPGGDRRQQIDAAVPLRGDGIAAKLHGCASTPE